MERRSRILPTDYEVFKCIDPALSPTPLSALLTYRKTHTNWLWSKLGGMVARLEERRKAFYALKMCPTL